MVETKIKEDDLLLVMLQMMVLELEIYICSYCSTFFWFCGPDYGHLICQNQQQFIFCVPECYFVESNTDAFSDCSQFCLSPNVIYLVV